MVERLRENCELLHASDILASSPLFLGKSLDLNALLHSSIAAHLHRKAFMS